MRVLVTWGSKHGGTAEIGAIVAQTLVSRGIDAVAAPAEGVSGLSGYDAVIIGGALYANRWPATVRRFVNRHVEQLRRVPVWLFSSGPLDDSADKSNLPPSNQVLALAERIGAKGHVTFGGRLEANAKGAAGMMAKTHAGDWRNPRRIRGWADELATALPDARPGTAIDHPARSIRRLLAHAVLGWALSAATLGGLLRVASPRAALIVHAVVAPLFFIGLAWHYFRPRGARDALPTAITWTAVVALLHFAVVGGAIQRSLALLTSITAVWVPLALIFLVTATTGFLMSTLPWPKPAPPLHPGSRKESV